MCHAIVMKDGVGSMQYCERLSQISVSLCLVACLTFWACRVCVQRISTIHSPCSHEGIDTVSPKPHADSLMFPLHQCPQRAIRWLKCWFQVHFAVLGVAFVNHLQKQTQPLV